MSLADYKPVRVEVQFPGGSFMVQGIGLDDLSELLRTHMLSAQLVFGAWKGDLDATFLTSAISDAPLLCAHTIVLASGEGGVPGTLKRVRELPFPIQLQALQEIGKLTFETVGGVGNAVAVLRNLMRRAADSLPAPDQNLNTAETKTS